jgi:hypothetical protein
MRRALLSLLLAGLLAGCASKIAHSERDIARHLNQTISVEGDYRISDGNEGIFNEWGRVILQRKDTAGIPPGTYVRGTGLISRGHLVEGKFVPDTKDSLGMRDPNDLVLRNAHVEIVPRPSTQPATWGFP